MKTYPAYMASIVLVVALGFGFSSCKEDEPTRPKLSFSEPAMSVGENAGVIEVELALDKAYGKDLTIEYTLGGTANDQDEVGSATADYEVVGDHGVVVIESGQTSGAIELEIYNDAMFEADETIEISILDINTGDVELTADDETEITITNDDSQLVASFAATTMTVNEVDGSDALIEVAVQLDKPAPTDIIVEYDIKIDLEDETRSDAIDSTYGHANQIDPYYYDYYIERPEGAPAGQLIIPAGSSTANIQIQLFTDFLFESDETIEMTLTPTDVVQVGTNKTIKITLEQQDGKVIALVWDEAHNDVDMDMFLWVGADTTNLTNVLALAINAGTTPRQELIFVPDLIEAGAFGLSYVYYSGTADPMNFEVHFADFASGVIEDAANRDIFAASYTLANVHAWDETEVNPLIVHKFVITGGVYAYGKIQVPATSSRMKNSRHKLPEGLRRSFSGPSRVIF